MNGKNSGTPMSAFLVVSPKKSAKGGNITESLYQELNSELRCAICTDIFTDPVVTP